MRSLNRPLLVILLNSENRMEKYLDEALAAYSKSDYYPFHMPGHKRQKLGDWLPEEIDITEIEGFDNLHHAQGIIKEMQERIAGIFGADCSFLLVNGSTSGLLAAICGSVKKGSRVLIGRNSHKAVYHAAYLMELKVEYLYPKRTEFGIQGSIAPDQVEEKLRKFPDTAAVVITSPTYDGVVSDIKAIAEIVHAHEIPLIVDEAHGAHFGFSAGFPQKALALGADLCIESLHKTLPSYTQTAVLHVGNTKLVDLERVKRYLGIYQSSSPSYVLMAGMDRCARMLQQHGEELFQEFERRLETFYRACEKFRRVQVFPYQNRDAGIWAKDVSKILISGEKAGFNGQQLYDLLLNRYHLQMEMASGHYVTALTSVMDTDEGFERLFGALQEVDEMGAALTRAGVSASDEYLKQAAAPEVDDSLSQDSVCAQGNSSLADGILTPEEIYQPREKRMEIFEAMEAEKQSAGLSESAGLVSGEFIYLYPPGIPLAAPGEIITGELLEVISVCQKRGMQVQGMADMDGKVLQVVFGKPDGTGIA